MLKEQQTNDELEEENLLKSKHVRFQKRCMELLPNAYSSLDTARSTRPWYVEQLHMLCSSSSLGESQNRMTVAFFSLSSLDVLSSLNIISEKKDKITDWIYSMQVLPDSHNSDESRSRCGFRGSSALGIPFIGKQDPTRPPGTDSIYNHGHIAMTYTALCSLLILGDDLSQINRTAIAEGLKSLQLPSGSFQACPYGSEHDMRFLYCACCISHIIQDWSGVDIERAIKYIHASLAFDNGIGEIPGSEGHGGTTFCAIASLSLMGQLETALTDKEKDGVIRWCVYRQHSGFNGRPNKPVDTCYSFWIGATLKLLGAFNLIDFNCNKKFILSTQDSRLGGFAKWPDYHPDALHSYLGLCSLSLMEEEDILPIDPALNISQRAADHLANIHSYWRGDNT